ncbi:MAG TPA: 3-hydroxyacyl-CoA dehydrogenase NAD-binding domain-containing protein [Candidatus Brocadiia bacterium]|nr:3-hydroxyacyl-CoA dehydrogenase NAD-binding domain-containing protein [Candidatus Brocadiia bacterium]
MAEATEKSFILEERPDGIGVLTFDRPGQPVNVFSGHVMKELNDMVGELEKKQLKGLILRSGKEGQFIAGADLEELMSGVKQYGPGAIMQVIELGHDTFTRLSRLPFPTLALVGGNALGGGCEITLAMDYCLGVEGKNTQIGLPEVMLGIIPGWGGTQRLPRVIGIGEAIQLAPAGKTLKADEAKKLGLFFDVVPPAKAMDEAVRILKMTLENGDWIKRREMMESSMGLSEDQHLFAFEGAKAFVKGQTKGQYPAPVACVQAMADGVNKPLQEGLANERKIMATLAGSEISRNLIGIFFMDNRIKKDKGVDDPNIKPKEIKKAGVVGAGIMGAGIATAFIRKDIVSPLLDIKEEFVQKGVNAIKESIGERLKKKRMSPEEAMQALALLVPTLSHEILCKDTDIIVEAVVERLDIKQQVFKKLESMMRDDAIIASNTSTISVTKMAECLSKPERFVGMHFFNPVDKMLLVEVIRGAKTNDQTVATTVALAKLIGKKPVVCKDCPGFVVNRILMPYLSESVQMLQEGAEIKTIDKAATKFGMPMGPITLSDMIGLDTMVHAGKVLMEAYPGRSATPMLLPKLFEAGRLGQKSGSGFMKYTFKKGKPKSEPDEEALQAIIDACGTEKRDISVEEMTDRMFLPIVNEASRLMAEGIVRDPGDVDIAMIYGTGFPPFRGGVLRWSDTLGAAQVVKRLEKLRGLGERFEPSPLLKEMAAKGQNFYKD